MADALDYIFPGTVLVILGFLACLNSFYLLLTGKRIESGLCQSVTLNVRGGVFPLESVSRVLLCIIGILIEVLTSSTDNSFLRSQDSQEMLMYSFYMFAAFVECCCILTPKLDRRVTMTSYAVASFIEAYIAFHFIETRQNSCITMCWATIAAVQGTMFFLQSIDVNNVSVLIVRNVTIIVHGTWFFHIAFSHYLYSTPGEMDDLAVVDADGNQAAVAMTRRGKNNNGGQKNNNNKQHNNSNASSASPAPAMSVEPLELSDALLVEPVPIQVSKVAFDFVLHWLLAFMLTVWIFIWMSLVLRDEDAETARDDFNGTRQPLVDNDDEEAELSDFEDMKTQLDSKVVPETNDSADDMNDPESQNAVTNFGI